MSPQSCPAQAVSAPCLSAELQDPLSMQMVQNFNLTSDIFCGFHTGFFVSSVPGLLYSVSLAESFVLLFLKLQRSQLPWVTADFNFTPVINDFLNLLPLLPLVI